MYVPEDMEAKNREIAEKMARSMAAQLAKEEEEEEAMIREQREAERESRRLAAERAERQARLARVMSRSVRPRFRAPAYASYSGQQFKLEMQPQDERGGNADMQVAR